MHPQFADWYQPATFGHDRDTIELRWQGVASALQNLDIDKAMDLVRTVFRKPLISQETTDWFRERFKVADATFQTTGNERELEILAGCVLALKCIDENLASADVALAILTASLCNTIRSDVGIDLIGKAQHRIEIEAAQVRARPVFNNLQIFESKKAFAAVNATWTATPTLEKITDVIKGITSATTSMFNSVQAESAKHIQELGKCLSIQDEELQLLWWIVGQRSNLWQKEFSGIEEKARPILLGYESCELTKLFVESPSLKALLLRTGIDATSDLTVPEAVIACGADNLKKIDLKNTCPYIFPLHFAIERAIETDADETWVPVWSKKTGLSSETRVPSLDLALQLHREHKLAELIAKTEE